jgi:CRP-like cAMP-binding protein
MHNGNATVNFLSALNDRQRQAIETIASPLQFRKKDYIFRANITNNTIYILLAGRVKLFRLAASGHECIQWFCFPGEIFGMSENTQPYDNGLYAQSMATTDVYALAKSDFNQLVTAMPSLALLVIEQLTHRVRTLGDTLLHVTCDDAHERLVNLLQRLGSNYGKTLNNEIIIDLKLTHQDIADMIGVCRQTVSTLMAQLKRQGVLASDRRVIVIKQPAMLDRVTQQQRREMDKGLSLSPEPPPAMV